MADELPPDLEEEEVPGGKAVTGHKSLRDKYVFGRKFEPKKNFSQRLQENREKLGAGVKEEAKDQAKKAVSKVVKEAAIQAARAVYAWIATAIGPYVGIVIVIVVIIIAVIIAITAAYGITANNGIYGKKATQAANKYDPSVIGDIRVILGDQIMVSNNPQDNYFSQGDPSFNTQALSGSWPSGKNKLAEAGCGITSCTMMMRYYGVTNITPVDFANRMAKENGGSLNLVTSTMLEYINPVLKSQGKAEKSLAQIAPNAQAIAKYIQNGDPVLAHGNPICGSSGQHYVLIVGISKDYKNFVISDPAASKPRQSAARYCSNSELLGGILDLTVLQ